MSRRHALKNFYMEKEASRKVMRAMREANNAVRNRLFTADGGVQISKRSRKILEGRGIKPRYVGRKISNMEDSIMDSMEAQLYSGRLDSPNTEKIDALYEKIIDADTRFRRTGVRQRYAQRNAIKRERDVVRKRAKGFGTTPQQDEFMGYFNRELPTPPARSSQHPRSTQRVRLLAD